MGGMDLAAPAALSRSIHGRRSGGLNYVILQKEAFAGLRIDRADLHALAGTWHGRSGCRSRRGGTAPPLVVHWAGMKAIFLRNMVGGDLLQFFERLLLH